MKYRYFVLLLVMFSVVGCAQFLPNFETPTVNVTSFRALPGQGPIPMFEIGLHVINPNRIALNLEGISYHVDLEGHRVLSGVSNQLPVIEAYGEGDVVLRVQPDIFSTISLFTDLLNQPRDQFRFDLIAYLDVGGFMPKIKVQKEGLISLNGERN
jgi:LEA14-like dessication related protein